jgi:hypothetical protein
MRFVCGPIPPSRVLNPREEGWIPLREKGATRLAVVAILLGLPFLLTAIPLLEAMRLEVHGLFKAQPLVGGAYFLALLGMVPAHELIHALAYGQGIGSPHLMIGFWPSRCLGYAIYDSPMPRRRVLAMVVAPFLVFSVLPLLCLPWLHGAAWGLLLVFALLHAAICGGDGITSWRLFSQVPSKAWVHNHCWQTYWSADWGNRPAEGHAAPDRGR